MSSAVSLPDRLTKLIDFPSAIAAKQYLVGNPAGTSLEFRSTGRVDVRDYTLNNDGKCIRSGAIAASDNTLTDTYSLGMFVAGDVGKAIFVKGAGVAGATLTTTIASITNSNVVELVAAASTTVTYAAVGWGTSDATKVQQAITDAGANGGIFIPHNLNLFLNGTDIVTTAIGQSIYSEGNGAALICGGIEAFHQRCRQENLRLIGPGTYGINITDPSLQQFDLNPNDVLKWWTENRARGLQIWDKTYGVYNAVGGEANLFTDMRVWYCGTGLYINHNNHYEGYTGAGGTGSASGDCGDSWFSNCWWKQCTTGMHIVKTGGLVFDNCKAHACTTGLLIESTGVAPPPQGLYFNNLKIENCSSYLLKITSTSATRALWPRGIKFTNGDFSVGSVLLEKCDGVSFLGNQTTLSGSQTFHLAANAKLVFFSGVDGWNGYDFANRLTFDSGAEFVIYGMGSTNGAYIKTHNGVAPTQL